MTEYLTETAYLHEHATLNAASDGTPNPTNLYGMASFLLTCGYLAHKETKDNLDATAEEIAERLFHKI